MDTPIKSLLFMQMLLLQKFWPFSHTLRTVYTNTISIGHINMHQYMPLYVPKILSITRSNLKLHICSWISRRKKTFCLLIVMKSILLYMHTYLLLNFSDILISKLTSLFYILSQRWLQEQAGLNYYQCLAV